MSRKHQGACRLLARRLNRMVRKGLDCLDDPVLIVKVDQIDRSEAFCSRYSPKRCQPQPRIRFDGEVLHENLQLLGRCIRNGNAKAEKALAGLVVHTVLTGFHDLRLFRKLPGRRLERMEWIRFDPVPKICQSGDAVNTLHQCHPDEIRSIDKQHSIARRGKQDEVYHQNLAAQTKRL